MPPHAHARPRARIVRRGGGWRGAPVYMGGCCPCPDDITMVPALMGNYRSGVGDDTIASISADIGGPAAIDVPSGAGMGDPVKDCIAGGGSPESCASAGLQPWQKSLQSGSSSSSSGGFVASLLGALTAPKPGAYPPGMYPPGYPYQTGMSTTTKIVLAGGAALALVLIARR